jgi:hypothetical protein
MLYRGVPSAEAVMTEWIQAHAQNTKAGDVVKVKNDAFSHKLGISHNGRICEVLEIKSGDFIVKSIDDKTPILKRTFYSPNILEKKVQ